MIILSANDIEMAFGEDVLFSGVTFDVQSGEKVGLVGINGTGKTTLFKIIKGEAAPEKGSVAKSSEVKFGYMEQHVIRDSSVSVYDETLTVFNGLIENEAEIERINAAIDGGDTSDETIERQMRLHDSFERNGGLTFRARTKSALMGLGFFADDLEKPISVLSGGEKSKVQLAKLLLSDANLLLLDEPTNHLDIAAVEWLEKFLCDYRGAYIVISHDRYFLDTVTTKTVELENKHATVYKGNYSRYLVLKEEARIAAERVYERTLGEIKRIEGIIEQQKRFNQEHNYVTIASKQKSIDRLQATLVKPEEAPDELKFNFSPKDTSGNDVLITENLALTLDGRILFRDVNLDIKQHERVFILGANGCGKTSLLRILMGQYQPTFGEARFGARVEVGYYDQLQSGLSNEKRVIDEIWDAFPKMSHTEVRCALGMFLFRGDDVFKTVGNLSGGEKARVALLKLMLGGQNFLLLDEPTNHLDISGREALENALLSYGGTMLIVSHDRYLINKLADRVYYLDENGAREYKGNYDAFIEKRTAESGMQNAANSTLSQNSALPQGEDKQNAGVETATVSKLDYKRKKELESERRRLSTRVNRGEELISKLEADIDAANLALSDPENAGDYEKAIALTEKLAELNKELEAAMTDWDEATEALGKAEEILAADERA